MFEAYHTPLPDLPAYLRRLELTEPGTPTVENLQRLITAHVTRVPFENLQICLEKTVPDLTVEGMFRKLVVLRRGGWCFELCGLFYSLLQELGYEAYPVGARVILRHPDPGPVDHRAAICTVQSRRWFCDVGFGATLSFYPVAMDGEPTPDGYFVDGGGNDCFLCRREADGSVKKLLLFSEYPARTVDFIPANYYMATVPGGHFQAQPVVHLRTENGRKSLVGRTYQETGKPPVELDETDFTRVLKEEFGIEM